MLLQHFSRQLPTTAARRAAPSAARFAASPIRPFVRPSAVRLAANPQSGKPASDSWSHTAKNVKEEAGAVRASLENVVAGLDGSGVKEEAREGGTNEILSDAKSVTAELAKRMPRPALLWGAAGIVPYVSTAGASIYLARQTQLVADGLDSHIDFETASALLLHAQNVQIQFGAVLLSFLGAIHWGFEFAKYGGEVGNRRYVLGLIPVMCAWPTLMLSPQLALIGQWGAYVLTWFVDLKATTAGWAPRWYSSYRFALTAAVGVSIIATLAGTEYYDADKSRSSQYSAGRKLEQQNKEDAPRRMELLRASARGDKGGIKTQGQVGGDVESEEAGEDGDSFVKFRNPVREEKERKEKEEEERKKKEEEAKKKKEEASGSKKDDAKDKKGDGEEKEEGSEDEGEGDEKKDE